MKESYRYWRDGANRPRVTQCNIKDGDKILATGYALCSHKDNPRKSTGKAIAKGRALQALNRGDNVGPIFRGEALAVCRDVAWWPDFKGVCHV